MINQYHTHFKWVTLLLCPIIMSIGFLIPFTNFDNIFVEINKDTLINLIFVKKGWFWTSLILWYCIIRYHIRPLRPIFKRYAMLTVWWFLFTQAIIPGLVPPIMDLIFLFSGGSCQYNIFDSGGNINFSFHENNINRKIISLQKIYKILKRMQSTSLMKYVNANANASVASNSSSVMAFSPDELLFNDTLNHIDRILQNNTNSRITRKYNNITTSLDVNRIFEINKFIVDTIRKNSALSSSNTCRIHGGYWNGGHDPSGHIFLLTLMIMLLLGELPNLIRVAKNKYQFMKRQHLLVNEEGEEERNVLPSSIESERNLIRHSIVNLLSNGPILNLFYSNERNKRNREQNILIRMFILPPYYCIVDSILLLTALLRIVAWDQPIILFILLIMMWCYSLLVTTTSFHTHGEQLSGLFFAYLVAGVLYLHHPH